MVEPTEIAVGDRNHETARAGSSASGRGGRSSRGSGGPSRRPVPDSPKQPSKKAAKKRRRAEAATADDPDGEKDPHHERVDDPNPEGNIGLATPAAKHARRSLYGTVTGLMGRAVGLLTPGRARPPTELSLTPTGDTAAVEPLVSEAQADENKTEDMDEVDLEDELERLPERPLVSAVTTSMGHVSAGKERDESLSHIAATNKGTGHGPSGAESNLTCGDKKTNEDGNDAGTWPGVTWRAFPGHRGSSTWVTNDNISQTGVNPSIAALLSGQEGLPGPIFTPGPITKKNVSSKIKRASHSEVRPTFLARATEAASPSQRRESESGERFGGASIRMSTIGDDDVDVASPTPLFPRRGDLMTTRTASSERIEFDRKGREMLPANGGSSSDGHRSEHGRGGGAGFSDGTSQKEAKGEEEPGTEEMFTPTQLRDLVRALKLRRGLPPAAAMYILSKMKSKSAACLRQKILREYQCTPRAAQDTSAAEGVVLPTTGNNTAGPRSQHQSNGPQAGRTAALPAPVAQRFKAPLDADSARVVPPMSAPLMPPPPLSSLLRRASTGGTAAGVDELRRRSFVTRSEANGGVRTSAVRLDEGVDLLAPWKRAQVEEARAERERSFALGTPGGTRVWKPAASPSQGTPWTSRSQRRSTPVRRTAFADEGPRHGGLWSTAPDRNEDKTPAEKTRRIISILEDSSISSSPRLPERSPARDARALRPSRDDDDSPLPTKTLSVPYPVSGSTPARNASLALAPARLPPSRWARRSETLRKSLDANRGSTGGEHNSPVMTQGKRKISDQGGQGGAVGKENRNARLSEEAEKGASDQPSDAEPSAKRKRLSGDGTTVEVADVVMEGTTSAADRRNDCDDGKVGTGDSGGSIEEKGASKTLPADGQDCEEKKTDEGSGVSVASKIAEGKSEASKPVEAGPSSGLDSEDVAKAKRIAARRCDRERRPSNPLFDVGEKVDPKLGLPTSLRPSDLDFGLRGGTTLISTGEPSTKFWVCRGCYVKNFMMSAKKCDMCRLPKDFNSVRRKNPPAYLTNGRMMYTNNYSRRVSWNPRLPCARSVAAAAAASAAAAAAAATADASTGAGKGTTAAGAPVGQGPGDPSSTTAAAPAPVPTPSATPAPTPSPAPASAPFTAPASTFAPPSATPAPSSAAKPAGKLSVTFQLPEANASLHAGLAPGSAPSAARSNAVEAAPTFSVPTSPGFAFGAGRAEGAKALSGSTTPSAGLAQAREAAVASAPVAPAGKKRNIFAENFTFGPPASSTVVSRAQTTTASPAPTPSAAVAPATGTSAPLAAPVKASPFMFGSATGPASIETSRGASASTTLRPTPAAFTFSSSSTLAAAPAPAPALAPFTFPANTTATTAPPSQAAATPTQLFSFAATSAGISKGNTGEIRAATPPLASFRVGQPSRAPNPVAAPVSSAFSFVSPHQQPESAASILARASPTPQFALPAGPNPTSTNQTTSYFQTGVAKPKIPKSGRRKSRR